ncbi:uncharacterized protein LOC113509198 [Galleria mellonella]|uniref:Uncharacterized protein LOC113509198 n=1 Tax=Galleria mellonella TaxID=7137 RepID=A0A6J3BZF1_GALME|nr:uncharacterized protein LOC113509198 [Galleria mellonella]
MTGSTIPYDNMSTPSKPLPFFTKCCFCIPLRIGCFILGYFSLVIKTVHTITLIGFTAYFGYTTHGFDHFDRPNDMDERRVAELDIMEKPILKRIELFFAIALLANFIWLFVNIACLVGLHKRRPGPVRLYVSFATFKLILSLVGIISLMGTDLTRVLTAIFEMFTFVLAAYFILVYYVYAMQLEREEFERQSNITFEHVKTIGDIYPTKLDKQNLVA